MEVLCENSNSGMNGDISSATGCMGSLGVQGTGAAHSSSTADLLIQVKQLIAAVKYKKKYKRKKLGFLSFCLR